MEGVDRVLIVKADLCLNFINLHLHICPLRRPLLHVLPHDFLQLVELLKDKVCLYADLIADFSAHSYHEVFLFLLELLHDLTDMILNFHQEVNIVRLSHLDLIAKVLVAVIKVCFIRFTITFKLLELS